MSTLDDLAVCPFVSLPDVLSHIFNTYDIFVVDISQRKGCTQRMDEEYRANVFVC